MRTMKKIAAVGAVALVSAGSAVAQVTADATLVSEVEGVKDSLIANVEAIFPFVMATAGALILIKVGPRAIRWILGALGR